MFRGIRINILVVFLFVPALFINAQDRITDDKVFVGYGTGRNMRSADNMNLLMINQSLKL